jgi:hypothetical protein
LFRTRRPYSLALLVDLLDLEQSRTSIAAIVLTEALTVAGLAPRTVVIRAARGTSARARAQRLRGRDARSALGVGLRRVHTAAAEAVVTATDRLAVRVVRASLAVVDAAFTQIRLGIAGAVVVRAHRVGSALRVAIAHRGGQRGLVGTVPAVPPGGSADDVVLEQEAADVDHLEAVVGPVLEPAALDRDILDVQEPTECRCAPERAVADGQVLDVAEVEHARDDGLLRFDTSAALDPTFIVLLVDVDVLQRHSR